MSNATLLFDNSELALASYSKLVQGDTANQRAALTQATGAQMSLTQATEFARRYPTVVTQFNDTAAEFGMGTSFSVTVHKARGHVFNFAYPTKERGSCIKTYQH